VEGISRARLPANRPILRATRGFFDVRSTALVVVLGAAFIGVVCGVDYLTGPDLSLSLLYLMPIGLVTWNLGRRWGAVAVITATAAGIFADVVSDPSIGTGDPVTYWNAMVRFAVFMVFAVLLDTLHTIIDQQWVRAESESEVSSGLRELNEAKDTLLHAVSHDLKSPLVTIRGFLGYVAADAREGDLTRLEADVGRIHAATERMGRLLDDLLELSRTGRIARAHEDVPLLEVVREARGLVEGRLGARGVRVEVEGPLPSVHGDAQQLVDLLQNLLDNAAKFMGAQAEPRVWIGSRGREDALLVLFVRDNGIGIAPAHQAQVFEPFCRLDPRAEGTGLGLALARRIVETHGGRLWVESEGSGRGSTFCFTLPEAAGSGGA